MSDIINDDTNTAAVRGGCMLLLAILIGVIVWGYQMFWGEQEGTVKIDDCRTTLEVKANSSATWFKQFTCSYVKSQSGKILSGRCLAVTTDGGTCETVYYYEKQSEIKCSDPKFPYAGYDDMCHGAP